MRRSLLVCFLATLVLVSLATPAAFAQGVNLYWNDCEGGTGATINKTFACDTDTGDPLTMVLSVFPPVEMPQFVGLEARIDALVNAASLPPWWQTMSGQCRAGAIGATCDPNSFPALSCPDLWTGTQVVSISQVTSAPVAWGFRIQLAGAIPAPNPITTDEVGQEIVAGIVRIMRAKTVGADACSGCQVGACFVLTEARLSEPTGGQVVILSFPATNNWVQLNGGTGYYNCFVPALNRTWGAIKTLYR